MERVEAAKLALIRYNTGRRCKNGHNSDRYTKTGACIECNKLATKIWEANLLSKFPTVNKKTLIKITHIVYGVDISKLQLISEIYAAVRGIEIEYPPAVPKDGYWSFWCHPDDRQAMIDACRSASQVTAARLIDATAARLRTP